MKESKVTTQDKKSDGPSSGSKPKRRRRRRKPKNAQSKDQAHSSEGKPKKTNTSGENSRPNQKQSRPKSSGSSSGKKRNPNSSQPNKARRRGGQNKSKPNGPRKKTNNKLNYTFSEGSFKLDPIHALNAGDDFNPNLEKFEAKTQKAVFYDTAVHALADLDNLEKISKEVQQLNIIIKAEGERTIPELVKLGKVFRGEAWTTIHERRVEDQYYQDKSSLAQVPVEA